MSSEPQNEEKQGEEKQGEEKQDEEGEKFNLFSPQGVRKAAYWQCMMYIAPSSDKCEWKNKDSVGTYCTVCRKVIPYNSKSNPRAVERHMESTHPVLLEEFKEKFREVKKRQSNHGDMEKYCVKQRKTEKAASVANQKEFSRLVVEWVASSVRPFMISEDAGLQKICDFAGSVDGRLKLPSRNKVKKDIDELAIELASRMKNELQNYCLHYALTSDLWSSRTMQAFMAMTIHFLTEDFTMRNYTLEVCPVLGKHTADMIRGEMGMALTNWNLKKENITMMLRDSGSNMVKACRDWGINHFACIGHSLHLVIGPFLVNKKKKRSTDNEVEYEEELGENEAEDTDYVVDDFNEDLEQDECVAYVREVVHEIRNICKYIKNSTKAKEKFEHLQKQLDMENILAVKLDVRTRWNSTYHMLEQVIKVIEPLRQFLAYFASPLGRQEFKGTKALPDISYEKWALIQGLCYLVRIFDKATKILSGEEYSTFVAALPVLRKVKAFVSDEQMFIFELDERALSGFKLKFFQLYGTYSFFPSIVKTLDTCRKWIHKEFVQRFTGLHASIMWTSLLDPRFGFGSSHWKESEKESAKALLIREVKKLAIEQMNVEISVENSGSSDESCHANDEEFDFEEFDFNFHQSKQNAEDQGLSSDLRLQEERICIEAEQEVNIYLHAISMSVYPKNFDPLEFWRKNHSKYFHVARVARKWLCVTATSTPSERVFSICGVVNSAKRSSMTGKSIQNQVFVHNNVNKVFSD